MKKSIVCAVVGRIFDLMKKIILREKIDFFFTKKWIFLNLSKILKIRPTTAQKMLFFTTENFFDQIGSDLRVQTLASVKHVKILKLLFSQAVTASRVPADG